MGGDAAQRILKRITECRLKRQSLPNAAMASTDNHCRYASLSFPCVKSFDVEAGLIRRLFAAFGAFIADLGIG
jgi:hypothetical protein